MGRNIETVIAGLPKERRARINSKARQKARGLIAHADSLAAVRGAVSKTQSQMGAQLGKPHDAISQLEKRDDLLVSTLVGYVEALGAELDLVVRMRDGKTIVLELKRGSAKSAEPSPRKKKAVVSYHKRQPASAR